MPRPNRNTYAKGMFLEGGPSAPALPKAPPGPPTDPVRYGAPPTPPTRVPYTKLRAPSLGEIEVRQAELKQQLEALMAQLAARSAASRWRK